MPFLSKVARTSKPRLDTKTFDCNGAPTQFRFSRWIAGERWRRLTVPSATEPTRLPRFAGERVDPRHHEVLVIGLDHPYNILLDGMWMDD
jgi:hypothetical protein